MSGTKKEVGITEEYICKKCAGKNKNKSCITCKGSGKVSKKYFPEAEDHKEFRKMYKGNNKLCFKSTVDRLKIALEKRSFIASLSKFQSKIDSL